MVLYTSQVHTWHRSAPDNNPGSSNNSSPYFITTDTSLLLQHKRSLNAALESPHLWWAVGLSDDELEILITSSVCFGLYHFNNPLAAAAAEAAKGLLASSTSDTASPFPLPPADEVELIGLARLITDKITFSYLTDVYVLPAFEKRGLGTWLIRCVKEWSDQTPKLRQLTLITSQGEKEAYYAKVLGTTTVEDRFGVDGPRMYFTKGSQAKRP